MATTEQEIQSFAAWAREQLANGGSEFTFDELVDRWRALNPPPEELAESVAAVKAALADMEAGDAGIPADEQLARLRRKFDIAESE